MKRNMGRWVRKLILGINPDKSVRPIYPGYISFDDGSRPVWWSDELAADEWGKVYGVHEYEPRNPVGAFVVAEMGLAVFGEGGKMTWLPYSSIESYVPPTKDPIWMSLHVQTKSGETVELMFPRVGESYGFVQFLSRAIWEHVYRPTDHERS